MDFEKVKARFFWFIRKLRDDPSDILVPCILIVCMGLVVCLLGAVFYTDIHSQKAECVKFEIEVYVNPKTGEESPSGEEYCVSWISPVTGKINHRKK